MFGGKKPKGTTDESGGMQVKKGETLLEPEPEDSPEIGALDGNRWMEYFDNSEIE